MDSAGRSRQSANARSGRSRQDHKERFPEQSVSTHPEDNSSMDWLRGRNAYHATCWRVG